jgi:hypothetical protein
MNWKTEVEKAIEAAKEKNKRYLDVIDDVVGAHLQASVIRSKHGSSDLVLSALAHVTRSVHGIGIGSVPPISEGGWREPKEKDGYYVVAPAFAEAWWSVRNTLL